MVNLFAGVNDGGKKGIRAGWQISNFYDNGNSDDNLNSFYVGLFGEKKLVPLLRLGAGLEYHTVGTSLSSSNITAKYTRHSISIPVYLRMKLGPVYALGGVAPDFGISNIFKIDDEKIDLDDEAKTSTFDAPLFLGVGFKIAIVSIEARYHWGTMNLSKLENNNFKQQYFQIGAAVSF